MSPTQPRSDAFIQQCCPIVTKKGRQRLSSDFGALPYLAWSRVVFANPPTNAETGPANPMPNSTPSKVALSSLMPSPRRFPPPWSIEELEAWRAVGRRAELLAWQTTSTSHCSSRAWLVPAAQARASEITLVGGGRGGGRRHDEVNAPRSLQATT